MWEAFVKEFVCGLGFGVGFVLVTYVMDWVYERLEGKDEGGRSEG